MLSARRHNGTFSAAIVFIRSGKDGKPVARFWVKHGQKEEEILTLANDLTQSVSDDNLHFRLLDLSEIQGLDAQMSALRDEGFEILYLGRTGRRPSEN